MQISGVWSRNRTRLYYRATRDGVANIFEVVVETKAERAMTDMSRKRGALGANMLTADGKYLYFAWQENFGDMWVMDLVRGDEPRSECVKHGNVTAC